jgi:hypothetical protein
VPKTIVVIKLIVMNQTKAFKFEQLLLVLPITLTFVYYVFLHDHEINVQFGGFVHRTAMYNGTLFFTMFFMVPYFFHTYLRMIGKVNLLIQGFHVFVSLVLMAALLLTYSMLPYIRTSWDNAIFPDPSMERFKSFSFVNNFLWILTLFTQLAFMAYAFYRIFKTNPESNVLVEEDSQEVSESDNYNLISAFNSELDRIKKN